MMRPRHRRTPIPRRDQPVIGYVVRWHNRLHGMLSREYETLAEASGYFMFHVNMGDANVSLESMHDI